MIYVFERGEAHFQDLLPLGLVRGGYFKWLNKFPKKFFSTLLSMSLEIVSKYSIYIIYRMELNRIKRAMNKFITHWFV